MRKSCVLICYFIDSVVKIVLYLHFPHTKDDRHRQIKKKHEGRTIVFLTSIVIVLNLKHFASLFFPTKDNSDNFIFQKKVYFLSTLAIK